MSDELKIYREELRAHFRRKEEREQMMATAYAVGRVGCEALAHEMIKEHDDKVRDYFGGKDD